MIPLFKIHNPPDIGAVVQEVFDSGFLTEGGYADKFEYQFAQYVNNPHTCLLNSCTSALTIASRIIGITPGDEVITTPMTCMATNEPFYNDGANLVFADINPETGNISPDSIEQKITSATKCIIVVHWAGQPADMRRIYKIAQPRGIKIVEDAAHALGASYRNTSVGECTYSDFTCFSFQAIKHLTTADGGAICCKKKSDAERIRKLRWFGLDRKFSERTGRSRWDQDIPESGFKVHMNNLNAAIGLEQMKYIDKILQGHADNGKFYDENIYNSRIKKMTQNNNAESAYWIYSLLVEDIDAFKKHLRDHSIASDVVHVRNDQYKVFEKFKCDLPGLDYFSSRLINIPVGWWITESERQYIVDCVNAY